MKLEFGQIVSVTAKYVRRSEGKRIKGRYGNIISTIWKRWAEVPISYNDCIFLGYRTLRNGYRNFDSEYGYEFDPKEYFKVALVCPDKYSNPIYVPLDKIKIQIRL